jgi:Na+/H+ antiporter NhaD/arsenite permease-like protein
MFIGATALTAVTDNAALTYLGTLVPNLSDAMKYSLVAGAVAGGGLTVIANAPNPIGYGILNKNLGEDGISPLYLFLGSLPYTLIAIICLIFL